MTADEAVENLRAGLEAGRLAHAYMVVGSASGNARRVVETFLQVLHCEADTKPCGVCRGCREVLERTRPDVLWLEPEKRSRRISIAQIREDLRPRIFQTSFASEWKACVLLGADRLTPEAANAFLRMLEEPPGKTVFFLLTEEPQSLLPTIVSRCQYINVCDSAGVASSEIRETLHRLLDKVSGGGMLVALAAADEVSSVLRGIREEAEELEKEAASEEVLNELDETISARISSRYREKRTELMRSMLLWQRDILLLACGADSEALANPEWAPDLRRIAEGLTYSEALRRMRVVEGMNRQLEANVTEYPVLSMGFLKLAEGV